MRQQRHLDPPERLLMLARVADSLFWMSRYLERACVTARILDINSRTAPVRESLWESVIAMSGDSRRFSALCPPAGARSVFDFLAFREENPHSILCCLRMVREHARGIRERISRELWDEIDSFHAQVLACKPEDELELGPGRFCRIVKAGAWRFHGVARDTLPCDETWRFLEAGRALERASSSARIVQVEYGRADLQRWIAVLEALSADDSFRRRYRDSVSAEHAAEFLIRDEFHPRAVCFNLLALESALRAIASADSGDLAAEVRRSLAARPLANVLGDLQRQCRLVGEHIASSCFHYAVPA